MWGDGLFQDKQTDGQGPNIWYFSPFLEFMSYEAENQTQKKWNIQT